MLNQKLTISDIELFGSLPHEFSAFLKYTRKLAYDQNPNYSYIKSLFSKFIDYTKKVLYFD